MKDSPIVWTKTCMIHHVLCNGFWNDTKLDTAKGEIPKLRENPESFLHRLSFERVIGTVNQNRGKSEKDWVIRSQAPKLFKSTEKVQRL